MPGQRANLCTRQTNEFSYKVVLRISGYVSDCTFLLSLKKLPLVKFGFNIQEDYPQLVENGGLIFFTYFSQTT
jgi:hypothetical protein